MIWTRKNRHGAVLILVAAGMVLFCGVAAVVIDLGRVYIEQNRIQKVTEAAAIAGGQELGRLVAAGQEIRSYEESAVKGAAVRYGTRNGVTIAESDVVVTADRVFVYKPVTVEYTFARVLGFERKEVAGNAVAKVNADGTTSVVKVDRYNVMPWAMPHGVIAEPYNVITRNLEVTPQAALTPGQEYILKLGGGPLAGGLYYPAGTQVLIPMGGSVGAWDQWNIGFKRAYGLSYWLAGQNYPVKWLLNYRGGSFMFDFDESLMEQLGAMKTSGGGEFGSAGVFVNADYFQWVKYEIVTDASTIIQQTSAMIVIDRAPRIGVYSSNIDAVTRTMDDAGLPFDMFHDNITPEFLSSYDWLHIHHEDFTGGGNDGGLAVPEITTVTDKTGTIDQGPSGGTIWIKATGFSNYEDGHRDIKVWFHNTQLALTNTATYTNDFTSADGMLVNADDNSRWEVSATVPILPNGTYRVYAQVKDEYTNYVDYTITGSAIAPAITVNDGIGKAAEGPWGGTITVTGGGFGPSSPHIYLKFDGTILTIDSTTGTYADDNVVGGLITATPGGSFEVAFATPAWRNDGTYEIQAFIQSATSNVALYRIENYLHPAITVTDNLTDPVRGPDGGTITVTGSSYRPSQAGVNVKFGGTVQSVLDTIAYPDDLVIGTSDITANPDGLWQVTFAAPAQAAGDYQIVAEHVDGGTGQSLVSNAVNYTLQDSANLTAEIYLDDRTADPASGPAGNPVFVTGYYFLPAVPDDIRLFIFSATTELQVQNSDGFPYDSVSGDLMKITADPQGRFEVFFNLPDLEVGTHEVKALYRGGTRWATLATYVVEPQPRVIYVYDEIEPYNQGTAGGYVSILGWGFTPGATGLKLYFNDIAMNPENTEYYWGDGVSGTDISANEWGGFDVRFRTPFMPPGTYILRVQGTGADRTADYPYILDTAEDFRTSKTSDFAVDANAFTVADTLHLKALCTNVNKTQMVAATATLTCAYHNGTHSHVVTLANNGDYSHSGSVAWAAIAGVHNGDWNVAFRLEDVSGNTYQPETSIHVSGTANVTESAIVATESNYSDQLPMLGVNGKHWFKIQSPDVDYSAMTEATYQFVCRTNYEAGGIGAAGHNTGVQALANNWNGTFTASYQCPSPDQHYGEYMVRQRIADAYGIDYESMKTVCFFDSESSDLLVSAYPYYDYRTTNFYKHGNIYFRTFKRDANFLDMKKARYRYRKYYSSKNEYSSYYNLDNNGNGMFQKEESLSPHQTRDNYYKFRVHIEIEDNNSHSYSTYKQFDLRSTVTANPFAESWTVAEGDPLGTLRHLVGGSARGIAAALHPESPLRPARWERVDRAIYLDGLLHESSPRRDAPPRREDAPKTPPVPAFAWMMRDADEPCEHATLPALVARYLAAPSDRGETWWAQEDPGPERFDAGSADAGGIRSWFASPARAAAYAGKYDLCHIFRTWLVNGGYMFAMCYGSETMDITLSKDENGKLIGYDYTLAFKDFGANRINDDDSKNFTIQDMSTTDDPYARPLAITQDHMTTLEGFTGSCTAYKSQYVKATTGPNGDTVHVAGRIDAGTVKYLGAAYGNGWFTYLGGHDPRLTEVYRLILNNILIGSLSTNIPSGSAVNYVVLDMDNVDDGEATDTAEYASSVKYGYPPALLGDIVTAWPGDLPNDPLVDTLPFNFPEETAAGVSHLVGHDMDRAADGEIHSWRTPQFASSRYVLVPICSVYKSDGSLTTSLGVNTDPAAPPEHVYHVLGRDKVRILRYGLFYLSSPAGNASGDPDLAETAALRDGEVRGKFIGYLK